MKGKINEFQKRLHWDWLTIGISFLTYGTSIWLNAINDLKLHPIFEEASKPFLVYIPFFLGLLTILIGSEVVINSVIVKIDIYLITIYWSSMTYIMIVNDGFHSHVSVIASVSWVFVSFIWQMAHKTSFRKKGVDL